MYCMSAVASLEEYCQLLATILELKESTSGTCQNELRNPRQSRIEHG